MSMLQQVPDPFALNAFGGVLPVAAVSAEIAGGAPTLLGTMDSMDVNSPATFAQNVQMARSTALRIQQMAMNVIMGIERAYDPSWNTITTAAELQQLRQELAEFSTFLVTTGVGALPLSGPTNPDTAGGAQKFADNHEMVMRTLYGRLMEPKDNASTVVGILTAPDRRGGTTI